MSEKCGFVLHAMLVPAMVIYAGYSFPVAWNTSFSKEDALDNLHQPFWALVLPTSLLILYLATYILYFAINSSIATDVFSTDSLYDVHTRAAPTEPPAAKPVIQPIYDQDVREVNLKYVKKSDY